VLCATRLRTENPPPNRLPPIHPRPRGTGALGAPTSSSAHGSAPPAEDRYPGSADVLVGTRLSSARRGQVPWERRRPRGHTVQLRPRRTGDGAPTTGGGMVDSLPPGQLRRISISPVRVLMSLEEEAGSKTKPSAAYAEPCAGSRSCIPRWRSKDVCPAATTVPGLVSPAGGGGHAPRVAGGGLCGPRGRAAVLWMDQSRNTRLPLLRPPYARQISMTGFPPSTSCKIRTICSSL
jgi:hypothetical protein